MHRTYRRLAAIVGAGLLAPIAITTASGAAIDQDLVVSATSGAPGDVITASSASCSPPPDDGDIVDRYFQVTLVSGDGTDAVLAGSGWGSGEAAFIVPDWVDPADAASVEASCITTTFGATGFEDTTEAYDPVPFDVLPGSGSPTQTSTYSRTTLLTGQSFAITGTGCATGGEVYGGADLFTGTDLSGRTPGDFVASGDSDVSDGTLQARTDLIDGSWSVGWTTDDGVPQDIQVEQGNTVIPPGTYTSVPYCGTYDEANDRALYLLLPPSLIQVDGRSPMDEMSMEVAPGTQDGTLTGLSCTAGDVEGSFGGLDLVEESSSFDAIRQARRTGASPFGPARDEAGPSRRVVDDLTEVPFTATPDVDGTWSASETAGFEIGVLAGEATCGDPLGEGFFYDVRLGVVEVSDTTDTTTTTSTVPSPAPAPATAVPGRPTYAG